MSHILRIILLTSFVRSLAISGLNVFYGVYLPGLGPNEVWIGLLMASGLPGMAVGTALVAKVADRPGRRKKRITKRSSSRSDNSLQLTNALHIISHLTSQDSKTDFSR